MTSSESDSRNSIDFFSLNDITKILFQAILQSVDDPFRIVDRDYRLLWANKREARQMIGHICYETIYKRTKPCPDCPVTPVFETGKSCTIQRLIHFLDEPQIWREIKAYPIYDESTNIIYAITIGHDISDRQTDLAQYIETMESALYNMAKSSSPSEVADIKANYNLSRREFEVLRLMAGGLTNREISCILSLSPHTVKRHIIHIFNKLGVSNRTQASTIATRLKLI